MRSFEALARCRETWWRRRPAGIETCVQLIAARLATVGRAVGDLTHAVASRGEACARCIAQRLLGCLRCGLAVIELLIARRELRGIAIGSVRALVARNATGTNSPRQCFIGCAYALIASLILTRATDACDRNSERCGCRIHPSSK
jgi:hypothetical protein